MNAISDLSRVYDGPKVPAAYLAAVGERYRRAGSKLNINQDFHQLTEIARTLAKGHLNAASQPATSYCHSFACGLEPHASARPTAQKLRIWGSGSTPLAR
jgi:hypothetical protein